MYLQKFRTNINRLTPNNKNEKNSHSVFITLPDRFKTRKEQQLLTGFTLIEILVVLGIIGLLSTLTMAGVNIARDKAREAKVLNDLDVIFRSIEILATDTGQWPNHQAAYVIASAGNNEICGPDENANDCAGRTLDAEATGLLSNDSVTPYPNWQGPYLREMPLDPWGHQYYFDTDYSVDANGLPEGCGGGPPYQNVVAIGSYGPDGLEAPIGNYSCDDIIKIILK